jgi:ribonuclease HI
MTTSNFVVVYADESCLGNQNEGPNPGGAASLIEVRAEVGLLRRDFYISSPGTTNNRMALSGAVQLLKRLAQKGQRLTVAYFSDSQYLVHGMRDWVPNWKARSWRRKSGPILNLELWKALDQIASTHNVDWQWVRGHAGHPKNEYVNDLAMQAAREQLDSAGITASGFDEWLRRSRASGKFIDHDPDMEFHNLERLSTAKI